MQNYNLPFYFAVPRNASKASREQVPQHLAKTFHISGQIEHVRSDDHLHLYRVVEAAR